jgi:hypothetical protein
VILWKTSHRLPKEKNAMTANTSIDPAEFLQDQLAAASPDLLRDMLTTFIEVLMGAEADAVCGAPFGVSGQNRHDRRGKHTLYSADEVGSSHRSPEGPVGSCPAPPHPPLGISLGIRPGPLQSARVNSERTEVGQSSAIRGVITMSVHLLIRLSGPRFRERVLP